MNTSTPEATLSELGSDDAAQLPPLVAWIRRWLPDAAVWPPGRGGRGSEPSDDAVVRDMTLALARLTLQAAIKRLGPAPPNIQAKLEAITDLMAVTDLERLSALVGQLSDLGSWDELVLE